MEPEHREGPRRDDVTLEGPFGWKLRASGRELKSLILMLVAFFALGYMLQQHDANAKESLATNDAKGAARAQEIVNRLIATTERMEEIGYILTLSEEERKALRLMMPDSMRKRTRPGREEYR